MVNSLDSLKSLSVLVDQKLKNINDYDTASLIYTKSGKQIIINNRIYDMINESRFMDQKV